MGSLKSCPNCGGRDYVQSHCAQYSSRYWVVCHRCMVVGDAHETLEQAEDAWNAMPWEEKKWEVPEICEHGGTKRGCLICELEAENARLREELKDATAERTPMGIAETIAREVNCPRCGKKHSMDVQPLTGKILRLEDAKQGEWYGTCIFDSFAICEETGQPVFPIRYEATYNQLALAC